MNTIEKEAKIIEAARAVATAGEAYNAAKLELAKLLSNGSAGSEIKTWSNRPPATITKIKAVENALGYTAQTLGEVSTASGIEYKRTSAYLNVLKQRKIAKLTPRGWVRAKS